MDEQKTLVDAFEGQRTRLRAVAYRMLGSQAEADDAVQESWLRLSRAGADGVDNLGAWLTTTVARIALDKLRQRKSRSEDPIGVRVPEPLITRADTIDPEQQLLLADSIGLALFVVLETLTPSERLAFVLHDMFAMPFEEIAPIVGVSATATRQLASRGRRRVQGSPITPDADLARQREVVDAFIAASREGNFDALLALLDPDVVLRADVGESTSGKSREVRGADEVTQQARSFSRLARFAEPALVHGAAGLVVSSNGRTLSVMGFTVVAGKIVAIDILADPVRLQRLDLATAR
jgi:RNA polymerase sigma-70 factor (ECF subfamily)